MRLALLALPLTACDLIYPLADAPLGVGQCSRADAVADDFEAAEISALWLRQNNGALFVENGEVRLELTITDSEASIETIPFFDLRGGASFSIEFRGGAAAFGGGAPTNFVSFDLMQPGFVWSPTPSLVEGDALVFRRQGSDLTAGRYVDGQFNSVRNEAFPDNAPLVWKIGYEGDEVVWSVSEDGTVFREMQRLVVPDVGMVRPRILAHQGVSGAFQVRFDQLNGGGPATGNVCESRILADDFETVLDPNVWSEISTTGCQLVLSGGKLVLEDIASLDNSTCSLHTGTVYDLHQGGIAIEIDQVALDSDHVVELVVETLTEDARFAFDRNNELKALGTRSPMPYANPLFDPTGHRFVRLRAERNAAMEEQLIWETSPDGADDRYTLLAQTGDYVGLDRVRFAIRLSGSGGVAQPGAFAIEGVNVR